MCQATDKLLTWAKKYSLFSEMRNSDQDFFAEEYTDNLEAESYYNEAFCALKVWF